MTAIRRAYPRQVEIERAVNAGKKCGLDVAGYDVRPDGTIRIFEARAIPDPADEFAKWESRL